MIDPGDDFDGAVQQIAAGAAERLRAFLPGGLETIEVARRLHPVFRPGED